METNEQRRSIETSEQHRAVETDIRHLARQLRDGYDVVITGLHELKGLRLDLDLALLALAQTGRRWSSEEALLCVVTFSESIGKHMAGLCECRLPGGQSRPCLGQWWDAEDTEADKSLPEPSGNQALPELRPFQREISAQRLAELRRVAEERRVAATAEPDENNVIT